MSKNRIIWAAESRTMMLSGRFRFLRLMNKKNKVVCAVGCIGLAGLMAVFTVADVKLSWPMQKAEAAMGRAAVPSIPDFISMSPDKKAKYSEKLHKKLEKNPEKLIDVVGQELDLVMSVPSLKRTDGTTMVWQYRNDECVLDVYLDPVIEQDYAPVIHYEVRDRIKASLFNRVPEAMDMDNEGCIRSLLSDEI